MVGPIKVDFIKEEKEKRARHYHQECPQEFLFQKKGRKVFFKMKLALGIAFAFLATAVAFPQKEGNAYTNEAIKQAQNTLLIPKDAQIQKVQEGIEIGAYESIPGNQRINLFEILGDQVPIEVVNNLQQQVDKIGRQK